jgi:hypothetical protein
MSTGIHVTWKGSFCQGTWSLLVTQDETMGAVMDRIRRHTSVVQQESARRPFFEVWEPESPMSPIDLSKPLRHLWLRWWGPACRDEPDRKFHFCLRRWQTPEADSEILHAA